jgi:hypothetical protein
MSPKTQKSFNPLAMIPSADAVRRALAEHRETVRGLEILLGVAEGIEQQHQVEQEPQCELCRFFQSDPRGAGVGWCKRFPPELSSDQSHDDACNARSWAFPYMDQGNSCGEFQQKPQPAPVT